MKSQKLAIDPLERFNNMSLHTGCRSFLGGTLSALTRLGKEQQRLVDRLEDLG